VKAPTRSTPPSTDTQLVESDRDGGEGDEDLRPRHQAGPLEADRGSLYVGGMGCLAYAKVNSEGAGIESEHLRGGETFPPATLAARPVVSNPHVVVRDEFLRWTGWASAALAHSHSRVVRTRGFAGSRVGRDAASNGPRMVTQLL
jgi:hypothetical protein